MEKPKYSCKLGILTRPDGSAMFCEGETTVVAGIYGPIEVKMQKIRIEKASVECNFRPKSGIPGIGDRLYESLIRNICETALVASLYPRYCNSWKKLGNRMPACNLMTVPKGRNDCSCLMDGLRHFQDQGIDMKFMFGAVTYFLTMEEELVLIPPLNKKDIKALFVFVFDNCEEKVLASHTEGNYTREQFEEAIILGREESKNVCKFFTLSMRDTKC